MPALQSEIDYSIPSANCRALVRIQPCRTWTELQAISADWNHLLQICPGASIFQTPEWLGPWWAAFGGEKELFALVFRSSEGEIVGIAPLYIDQKRFLGTPVQVLRMVGAGSGDSDALDFVTAPGYEESCARAFLSWLDENRSWDVCALETLPENSRVAQHISDLVQNRGWPIYSKAIPNFFIELPSSWSEYLGTLEPGFQPLLTRYPKRLKSRYSVSIQKCEAEEELDAALQALFTLHQLRWAGRGIPGAFSLAERRDFYLRMTHSFFQRGWLEFWLLKLNQEIVATQFCFRYGNTVYLLQEGFHPQYTADKVGYALRAHVLQEMIRTGATRYDFLGGADAYKERFGARQGSYLTLRFAGKSWRGRLYLALQHRKQEVKQWLKRKLPTGILARLRSQEALRSRQKEPTD
jgi:CelD/BcsL family acetyltransferase involved in cellulose biosynthesis